MRVLMHIRPDWRELPGGDFVQLQRWTVWLRARGIDVTVSDAAEPELAGIDLVHFHNLGRAYALLPTLRHCRGKGVPAVLTPLYWPTTEYENHGRPGLVGQLFRWLPGGVRDRVKAAIRSIHSPGQRLALLREAVVGAAGIARRFLNGFQALIANSRAEADALRILAPAAPPIHVVHSGVDASYWSEDRDLWIREQEVSFGHNPTPSSTIPKLTVEDSDPNPRRIGVLCVARFDPQKAQHRLIKALAPLGLSLTLAGPDNPNYPRYRAYCQKIAATNVTFLSRQDQHQLKALYRRCQVHALCSWYETTGLTGLEAGCCGGRVVMTVRGGTREYGGDRAWYADPADLDSIRQTVEEALKASATPDLRGRVRERFTWERSAAALREVYRHVLGKRERAAVGESRSTVAPAS